MIKLDLVPLKFEASYNNKCYIIEAVKFNEFDETKWIITEDGYQLTKQYNHADRSSDAIDVAFNSKDEAVEALNIYLLVEDKLEKTISSYKEEISLLKDKLGLSFLYKGEDTFELIGDFLSVHDIEAALNKRGCFRINKSSRDCNGVQVSVSYIHNMLLLEKVIHEIAEENDCKIINIYNDNVPHIEYNSPLYYYWDCGNDFTRQFALLKNVF